MVIKLPKIIYFYNSGFAVCFDRLTVVLDYYGGNRFSDMQKAEEALQSQVLSRDVPLFVLATHAHPDHFDPRVLTWRAKGDITYIFSDDIPQTAALREQNVHWLCPGKTYRDKLLFVEAFGSTDAGCAFYFEAEDRRLFHAGDLNNWHWEEESTQEEAAGYERAFLAELQIIARKAPRLDVAMFPVDPRLGADYMRGAKQFVDKIEVGVFIPMHFGVKYEKANRFKAASAGKVGQFVEIVERGQEIHINNDSAC